MSFRSYYIFWKEATCATKCSFRAQDRREITEIYTKKKSLRNRYDADQEGREHKVLPGIGWSRVSARSQANQKSIDDSLK